MLDLVAAATIVMCLVGLALLMRGERIAGNAFAIDGDTLVVDGRRVRLRGLDAPELDQTCHRGAISYRCGEEARAALRALVERETVTCMTSGRDRFERALGTCSVRGQDIGAAMVRRGLAVSSRDYAEEEREARDAKRGIWAGPFESPQAWRRRTKPEERS
jgi:endonuclease YncB( thermonuclease family)